MESLTKREKKLMDAAKQWASENRWSAPGGTGWAGLIGAVLGGILGTILIGGY